MFKFYKMTNKEHKAVAFKSDSNIKIFTSNLLNSANNAKSFKTNYKI